MRSKVYETVERLSVRPSVCLSVCLSHRRAAAAARAAGLLLSAQRAGDSSRRRRAHLQLGCLSSNGAVAANAGSVMLTTDGRG